MLAILMWGLLFNEAPFYEGSVNDVFDKAKQEEKVLVVDVYTEWCGPCKLMDRTTWKDETVRSFFEEKVIGYKIDAEKGEGRDFARKYKVSGYPCLLIFNAKGELIDKRLGYMAARDFLNWANNSLD
ncbi:Thioredoxin fold domain-containing protein [Sulfidibacter corallicola]|uniref:Thioredoxin fold domain-containing protein n=1 Tax=Sulfidibacter corallicola TaxID=2818388 RepID=A0A8A4TWR7_SULCO|nr:thioredoxin fold domain-containing protein [Sulfidibacter corallicola]QTD53412.1 thioredoxin fold domain-containing protein [Sulfidibacter corallicola]